MNKIEQNIPEGWSVDKLGNIGTFSKGANITKSDLVMDGLACVRYAELYTKYDFIIKKCFSFIPSSIAKTSKKVSYGDILFAGSGETKEDIGKCAAYISTEEAFAGGDSIIFSPKSFINPIFVSYYLNTKGRKQLNSLGQGDSIVHIHASNLKNVIIPIPPLPEQEKIAEILGTWDEGIEKLDNLIKAKEKQKKSLMQKLLTGKHRLKGFFQPWKETKLGDFLIERVELTTDNNQVDILTSSRKGLFKQEDYFDKQVASQNNVGYKIIYKGDFTYRAMTDDDIFCFNQSQYDIGAVSPAYAVFSLKNIPSVLMNHILNSKNFGFKLLKIAQGGTRKSLKFNSLKNLKIFIPTDLAEQKAIADILSKADEEIQLLKAKLDKLKEQKKGLMQKLLTGKIRVKV